MRGYAAIGLHMPKYNVNVGGVMRAAQVYGAGLVVVSGARYKVNKKAPTDTMRAWRHIPVIEADSVFDALPYDCVPIAVELHSRAVSLTTFKHPQRAVYIFGAEDQTLGKVVLDRCRDVVMIPTSACMNLAATANVVLYDRLLKQGVK